MNGFTSGYRATHGLPPANHDPEPYQIEEDDSRRAQWEVDLSAGEGEYGGIVYNLAKWKPRSEFDVPDNPILAEFRRLMGEIIQTGSRHTESPAQAAWWVELLEDDPNMLNPNSWGHMAGADRAHIKHARRVLAKLAAVYA